MRRRVRERAERLLGPLDVLARAQPPEDGQHRLQPLPCRLLLSPAPHIMAGADLAAENAATEAWIRHALGAGASGAAALRRGGGA
jgi:hypothetical protein